MAAKRRERPELGHRDPAGGQGPSRLVDPVHLQIEVVIGDICIAGDEKAGGKSQEGGLQSWLSTQPLDLVGSAQLGERK
jgi:hypothetical protein